jgi:hypothetical protein
MRPRLLPPSALLLALAALAACDSGGELPDGGGGAIDYQRLFADPTDAEIQAVRSDWAGRANPVRDARIEAQAKHDGATLYIVSHTQSTPGGGTFTHYGLARVPSAADVALPVLVYHHDGDAGLSVSGFLDDLALFPALATNTVVVAPVYRAETLTADTLGSGTYAAGGTPSPWDYDVDDAIGLLNAALALFPDAIDETQVGALGLGRGGNTALLHAIRDDRVHVVTEYYGLTDYFNTAAVALFREALAGNPEALALPGVPYLVETVLEPLAEETRSYEDARLDLVRRSPGFFGLQLPDTQVHHHQRDPVVRVEFSEAFGARIADNPVGGAFELNRYQNTLPDGVSTPHDPAAMPTSLSATQQFIARYLSGK